MSITLHSELGVNPKLTFCPRCGGEGRELILIGNRTSIYKCGNTDCGINIYGHRPSEPCPKCGERGPHQYVRSIEEHEKLPGGICAKCEAEIKEHQALVEAGGIYWRCVDCQKGGVIKATSECAKQVREHMKIPPPKPCGIEFTKKDCPVCSKEQNGS